jgi:hypothetical protein
MDPKIIDKFIPKDIGIIDDLILDYVFDPTLNYFIVLHKAHFSIFDF